VNSPPRSGEYSRRFLLGSEGQDWFPKLVYELENADVGSVEIIDEIELPEGGPIESVVFQ
jgi:hypothetical protein